MACLGIGLGLPFLTTHGGAFSPLSLFAAGEQGAWYDPSDLSTLFQDAAGTVPVTASGQPVGMIRDKSGRGNHATQSTAGSRPTYTVAGSLRYLAFDGVDDRLGAATGGDGANVSVAQAAAWSALGTSAFTYGNATNAGGLALFKSSGNALAAQYGIGASTSSLMTGTTALVDTAYVLGASTTGSDVRVYANLSAPVSSGAVSNPVGLASYNIGATAGGSGFLSGRLYGHVHVARAMSEPERLALIQYLASKSGIAL